MKKKLPVKSTDNRIDFNTFYSTLKHNFPKLQELKLWAEWDYSNDSCVQSVVISEVARELIRWAIEGNYNDVEKLLDYVELCLIEANDCVIAFIGTDFTVTILECENKVVRERIKKLMGPETASAYQINLRGYTES